jgi:DNA-binding NarL/FixJ family response regulator
VLLVDDQTLFVESLRTVLETRAKDFSVIGIAGDGEEALALTAKLSPDVILMDVRMPKMNGVEATKRIKEEFPATRILMLTTFDDDEYVIEALQHGAVGYLLKDMPPLELITAVRAVYEGGVLISPRVATKIVEKLVQTTDPVIAFAEEASQEPEWVKDLNSREKEILKLIAKGMDNEEIAHSLHIAKQTVKNYVSMIYCKLGVRDRVQASLAAIKAGLGHDPK